MRRKMLAFSVALSLLMLAICGCGKATVTTQTEIHTVTGPAVTQTVNVTGPVVTTTQTTTVPGLGTITTQTIISTITATVTGPTTTTTITKTGIPTQGITYVSSITPASPATLHFNDSVHVTVDYVITDPGGARMWAIPMTNGQNTPNGGYSLSNPQGAGKGSTTLTFYVASGAVKIDQIHLLMKNSTGATTLFEAYIPVDFTYGP